jgi:hypothetical protein
LSPAAHDKEVGIQLLARARISSSARPILRWERSAFELLRHLFARLPNKPLKQNYECLTKITRPHDSNCCCMF